MEEPKVKKRLTKMKMDEIIAVTLTSSFVGPVAAMSRGAVTGAIFVSVVAGVIGIGAFFAALLCAPLTLFYSEKKEARSLVERR